MTKSLELLRSESRFMDSRAQQGALELLDGYIAALENNVREMKGYRLQLEASFEEELGGKADVSYLSSPENVLGWATSALKNVLTNCRFDLLGSRCVDIATARRIREELQEMKAQL